MQVPRRTAALLSAAALAAGVLLGTAPGASADDYGGNGNPATDCANPQPVASATIYNSSGGAIGLVEMRWSWTCSGNWTRVTSYIGTQYLSGSISEAANPHIAASADDVAIQNFTPYLRVPSNERMCSTGSIAYGGEGYSATVCSS